MLTRFEDENAEPLPPDIVMLSAYSSQPSRRRGKIVVEIAREARATAERSSDTNIMLVRPPRATSPRKAMQQLAGSWEYIANAGQSHNGIGKFEK